jgi:NADH-quinone oxidoreductase subunit L
LDPVFGTFTGRYFLPDARNADVSFQWGAFVVLLFLILIGFLLARSLYSRGPRTSLARALVPVHTFLTEKWYFDRLYELAFERPGYWLASVSWRWLDRGIIDGLVNGVARGVRGVSDDLRPAESGYVRTYALSIVIGVVLVVLLAVGQR